MSEIDSLTRENEELKSNNAALSKLAEACVAENETLTARVSALEGGHQEDLDRLERAAEALEKYERVTKEAGEELGETIKVHLPGESVWADVLAITSSGKIVVALRNDPVSPLHGWHYDDKILVEKKHSHDDVWVWMPDESEKTMPLSPKEKAEREKIVREVFEP